MTDQPTLQINAPSLPKGGGAIQSIGKGWGAVGTTGAATFEIALPLSPGRGFAPDLSLTYNSGAGNGVCGLGWGLTRSSIARRTSKGVPVYSDNDEIVGPSGDVWMPERDAAGNFIVEQVSTYRGMPLGATYEVVRHFPRVEGAFDRIERWRLSPNDAGFWLVHGADGNLHLYGKRASACVADPDQPQIHVAEWLLEESLTPHGEHILYEYQSEDDRGPVERTASVHSAQRYLSRVRYGNVSASDQLYLWDESTLPNHWHFDLILDYGERTTSLTQMPGYEATYIWPVRSDAFSSFAYGFELRTQRRCEQVLMFHHFPDMLGERPVLTRRLLLEYQASELNYSQLTAAHELAYDAEEHVSARPPLEFAYSQFDVEDATWHRLDDLPGLNDGHRYQLVDLYGEGLPGVLNCSDEGWLYREPQRANHVVTGNEIAYGPWQVLPTLPSIDSSKPVQQFLTDLSGDGRLDWIVSQPGISGFFTLNPDRTWADFAAFAACPSEFFQPRARFADMTGSGLSDLALIGPNSVRLYANRREEGFADGRDVPHAADALPASYPHQNELIAFSDVLGSGQQHLVRIGHDEVTVWPNLGHGKFGASRSLGKLPFTYGEFDPARIRLADLDGSGATDLIYLQAEHALIFMNRCGHGFAAPIVQPWPTGVTYDNASQVSLADLQGLGCSSLILSVPHPAPRHWRCDFLSGQKPYLLKATNNNMGAASGIEYRSSAQEWLDEKQHSLSLGRPAASGLAFPVHVVSRQTQLDEITGNTLTQGFQYRQGYYDGYEREFRGFGLTLQTDTDSAGPVSEALFTPPALTKTWFHTGRYPEKTAGDYWAGDSDARPLGMHLLSEYDEVTAQDRLVESDLQTSREMARTLSGAVLRVEVYGQDDNARSAMPYSVRHNRYLVRQLRPRNAHQRYAAMLPLSLESVDYAYERIADDPRIEHRLNLRHDLFGNLTHGVTVNPARRKGGGDEPPFEDAVEQIWWRDACDPAQQRAHVSEHLSQPIHMTDTQGWRLGLAYRQRSNALAFAKDELDMSEVSYEGFIAADGPINKDSVRHLISLSTQYYVDCPVGEASFEALPGEVLRAELDAAALGAYRQVLEPAALETRLRTLGYEKQSVFLPDETGIDVWSVRHRFPTYAGLAGFYKLQTLQPTKGQGLTRVTYDPYHCFALSVTDAQGNKTVTSHDYRLLLPISVIDANGNTAEARFDAFGQVIATSLRGTERAIETGFATLDDYERVIDSPVLAIENPELALQDAATAYFYDAFSWMGKVPTTRAPDAIALASGVAQRRLLPSGHIRASARGTSADAQWQAVLRQQRREPVHCAVLQADRYPNDPQRQIRIGVSAFDGFGRVLQTKLKVPDGTAYAVDEQGALRLEDGRPVIVPDTPRWRVSERVEYNNKGLTVRAYRPYFADDYRYINDDSFRLWGHSDQQFYDPLGRPTQTINAKGYVQRQRHLSWYAISEDENDTAAEIAQASEQHIAMEALT